MSKSLEDLIDEDYERLDQEVYEMEELGLSNYGDRSYYIRNRDEYEKDKTIADLEAKLAESELEAMRWQEHFNNAKMDYECLEQQLAEKETRIIELEDKDWYEGTIKQLEEQNERLLNKLTEKEKEIEKYKELCTISKLEDLQIENMLLKGKAQDKISFAVEQLEKVEELAHNHIKKIANDLSEEYDERLNQKHVIHGLATAITDINNQIEELKKEMK